MKCAEYKCRHVPRKFYKFGNKQCLLIGVCGDHIIEDIHPSLSKHMVEISKDEALIIKVMKK